MKTFNLDSIVRENIRNLKPYASARSEYTGQASIYLDANENSFGSATETLFNRYPDPLQKRLRSKIAELKNIEDSQVFLGNGSDEPIDLLMRACCEPGQSNIIIMPPTYGMYEVAANINDVQVRKVPLTASFEIDTPAVLHAIDAHTRILFICSPNNPTGNIMNRNKVKKILEGFNGLVVVDEAYVEFSPGNSFVAELNSFPNLVVLQTFSKAWGLAALRLGMALASEAIINLLNKIKPPYNINAASAELIWKALENHSFLQDTVSRVITERSRLARLLSDLKPVEKVFESDANFLLVKVKQADSMYRYLVGKGIIVRNRNQETHCSGCLRITVGTFNENEQLITAIKEFDQ